MDATNGCGRPFDKSHERHEVNLCLSSNSSSKNQREKIILTQLLMKNTLANPFIANGSYIRLKVQLIYVHIITLNLIN